MNIGNEKRRDYYSSQVGSTEGSLPDLENQFLQLKTSSSGTTPDLWGVFLRGLGYSGTVDQMKDKWRTDTGGENATLDSSTVALLSRMSVQPSEDRKALIDSTIVRLKDSGIWSEADFIHFQASHDSQAAALCWNNEAYNLTSVGGVTFATDLGFVGNGVDGHLTTGALMNGLTNYLQDDAAVAVWETLAVTEDTYSLGAASNNLRLAGRLLSGNSAMRLNSTSVTGAASTDSKGLTGANRTDSANIIRYRNGVGTSTAQVSAALTGSAIYYLRSTGTYSNRRVGFGYVGGSLTAQQHTDMYNIVNDYMTELGAI